MTDKRKKEMSVMKSALVRLALTLLLGAAAAPVASAANPYYDHYKSWLIVCDNALTCEAKGFTEGAGGTPDLRFIRAAGAGGRIDVQLSTVDAFALDDLRVDGRPLRLHASDWILKSASGGTTLSTKKIAAVEQLLSQLRNGKMLQIGEENDAVVPLDGMVAALLRMDDRQGRVGGATALVHKGAAPASLVPLPPIVPAVPERRIAASISDAEERKLIKHFSMDALRRSDGCESDAAEHGEVAAYALDAKTALVLIPCIVGAYQTSSVVYIASRQNGAGVSLHLPSPDGSDAGDTLMTEAGFDPQTGKLAEFSKGRGVADCGSETEWVWNGQKFQLASATLQMQCGGSEAGDFPTIYRSVP